MTVKDQLNHFKQDCDQQIKALRKDFLTFKLEVTAQITPLRDYMIGQQAIKDLEKGKDVNISPAVWNIIKWLLLFIGALVTGRTLL